MSESPPSKDIFIYLLRSGQAFGPYPFSQFREMFAAGEILDDDFACIAGDIGWMPPFHVVERAEGREVAAAEEAAMSAEDVAQFKGSFHSDLEELQFVGFAKKTVSSKTEQEIFEKVTQNPDDAYLTLQEFLSKHFPKVLTAAGRQDQEAIDTDMRALDEAQRLEWRKTRRMGEFAPVVSLSDFQVPARTSTEIDATQKQIKYLLDLGVDQRDLGPSLGKWQASAMIDYVLKQRGDD